MILLEKPGGFRVVGLIAGLALLSGTACDRSERLLGPDTAEFADDSRQVRESEFFPPNWIGIDDAGGSSEETELDSSGISYQVDERDFFEDPAED